MRDWFRFVSAKADAPQVIYIYGDIGATFFDEDGVSAQSFVDQLDAITAAEIHVRINSPGGSAWDGLAIANAMIRHKAKVTTFVDGMAASAASLAMLGGDEVVVSKYGRSMLHNARALVMGTSDDMRDVATQIDALNANMASFYADRSTGGDDAAAFARAMKLETWYNAEEMLAAGLATRIDTSAVREEVEGAAASVLATTRMKFKAPPAALTKETRMATKDDLAKRLGRDPTDITDDDLYKAAIDALGEDKPDSKTEGEAADPSKAEENPIVDAPAGPVKDEGTVVVDAAAFADLKRQAEMGAQAFITAQAKADDDAVERAINEGRIPPSRKNHYLALMKADPADTTDLLTKRLAPGAAVPMVEMGHAADTTPSATVTEDPRYKNWKVG